MTVIKLPDQQTAALKAKAAAEGLSLKAWLQKLAEQRRPARHRHITNAILKNMRDAPSEITSRMPRNGASQREH
jgi:hypothetical protein